MLCLSYSFPRTLPHFTKEIGITELASSRMGFNLSLFDSELESLPIMSL